MSTENQSITIKALISAPMETVWEYWTLPEHIKIWNTASDDWHTPHAENDLRAGGRFLSTMAAKDGSFSFDFSGVYDEVTGHQKIAYTLDDGRKVHVSFESVEGGILVTETFEPEGMNPIEMQQAGWQAILDNFKKYTEGRV